MFYFVLSLLVGCWVARSQKCLVGSAAENQKIISNFFQSLLSPTHMPHLSAETKHHILLDYSPGVRGCGFKALAARHGIKGGATLLSEWHRRWNGTVQSLEEGKRSGRPRTFSSAQVRRHIAAPIRNANRAARAVAYPALLTQVQAATQSNGSLSTVKRYGKEELQATSKHGKKRTSEECQ
jgi:hypothetical protein